MMPAWYDIFELNINRKADIEGIGKSIDAIGNLIDQIKIKTHRKYFISRDSRKVESLRMAPESHAVTNLLAYLAYQLIFQRTLN